jgi:FkbM family methyltransferase
VSRLRGVLEDLPPPAPARPTEGRQGPAHTLPWWRRLERRWILSFAKRLASPAGRRVASRVPAVGLATRRFLSRVGSARVHVCGAPFRLDVMRRSVSRSVYLGGRWHADVVAMLRRHVKSGTVSVDVGANVGYMAVHMGEVAGPEGMVLAFEPEPRNFAVLAENARHARWRNVIPFPAAIGDRTEPVALHLSPRDGGDHRTVPSAGARETIRVLSTSLDALADERRTPIHFVKMDIQGAEGAAIRGGRRVLSRPELAGLVLEFWPGALRDAGEDPREILARLREAGLRCANAPGLDVDPSPFLSDPRRSASIDLLFLR